MNLYQFPSIQESHDFQYKKLLEQCYQKAQKSNHLTTRIAALLIDKQGNELVWGVNNLPIFVRPLDYRITGENRHIFPNHAERDVIYKAAREGIKTEGLMMVMPWIPCILCANACISSGISKLITHKQFIEQSNPERKAEFEESLKLLQEANISVIAYNGEVKAKIFLHGQWRNV